MKRIAMLLFFLSFTTFLALEDVALQAALPDELPCDESLIVDATSCVDLDNRVVFDDFDRASLTDTDASGHWWFDVNNASIDTTEKAMVFDNTQAAPSLYRSASPVNNQSNQYPYLVLTMKGSENTDLLSFAIKTISEDSDLVFYNTYELVDPRGNQLPSLTTEYQTFIIDLVASGLKLSVQGIHLEMGGWSTGQIMIGEIAFASTMVPLDMPNRLVFDTFDNRTELIPTDLTTVDKWWINADASLDTNEGALLFDSPNNEFQFYSTAGPTNNSSTTHPYLVLTMKGSEGTTLDSFRMNTNEPALGDARYFNNGHLVGPDGSSIPDVTTEYKTFVIDLVASGFDVSHLGLNLSFGSWNGGQLYIKEIAYAKSADAIYEYEDIFSLDGDTNLSVEAGASFTDPGVTVLTGFENMYTVSVKTPLDTSVVGTGQVTYEAKDRDDQVVYEFTRDVEVVDTTAPTLELNPSVDTVYVGSTHTDGGVDVTDVQATTTTVDSQVDTSQEGTYSITYTVEDASGNQSVIEKRVSVISPVPDVTFDLTPALTTLAIGDTFEDTGCGVMVNETEMMCVVDDSNVDTQTPGEYMVTYEVNIDGLRFMTVRYVFVIDDSEDDMPVWKKEEELTI